jgi:hypothetical protein
MHFPCARGGSFESSCLEGPHRQTFPTLSVKVRWGAWNRTILNGCADRINPHFRMVERPRVYRPFPFPPRAGGGGGWGLEQTFEMVYVSIIS